MTDRNARKLTYNINKNRVLIPHKFGEAFHLKMMDQPHLKTLFFIFCFSKPEIMDILIEDLEAN